MRCEAAVPAGVVARTLLMGNVRRPRRPRQSHADDFLSAARAGRPDMPLVARTILNW
jgi:hypothetical protein